MSETNKVPASSGGICFVGLYGVLFIVLKLTGNIDWSWPWVLTPLWAPLALGLVVTLVYLFIVAMAGRQ